MKELSKYQCEYCNTEYKDKSKCAECEDNHMSITNQMICGDALNLINRQKSEIERLKKELTEYKLRLKMSESTVDEIKSEAIKEFVSDFGVTNLWVDSQNEVAKHIYEKNGFVVDDTPLFVAMRVKGGVE